MPVRRNAGLRRGRVARRNFLKRRGFFFQGVANEWGYDKKNLQ
jgi:hypothetical protein